LGSHPRNSCKAVLEAAAHRAEIETAWQAVEILQGVYGYPLKNASETRKNGFVSYT
jgi:hypothetical protein